MSIVEHPTAGPDQRIDSTSETQEAPTARRGATDKPRSFHLKHKESFRKGVRRIVLRQLKKSLKQLPRHGSISGKTVHAVRKGLKRVRAVLRLVRSQLNESTYERENSVFRDAARLLNDVRNAKVLVDALEKLRESSGEELRPDAIDGLHQLLKARQRESRRQFLRNSDALDAVRSTLQKSCDRLHNWELRRTGSEAVRRGLTRTYEAGRRAFDAAENDATIENLHECRKQAKYFDHQLQIVSRVASASIRELRGRVEALTRLLGDDHDLAMLRREAVACLEAGIPKLDAQLLALIDRKRNELERDFVQQARPLYRDEAEFLLDHIREWSKNLR